MQFKTARRYLAGLGVAGAVLTIAAPPAAAQEPAAKLGVYFRDTTIAAGSAGKVDNALLSASKPVVLHEVAVRYDSTDLAGKVLISADSSFGECTAPAANVLLCTTPFEFPLDELGLAGMFDIRLAPTAGSKEGDQGILKVTFSAAGFAPVTHEARVRIGEGVDLAAGGNVERSAAPGEKFVAPLTVRNAGETTANGVGVFFDTDRAIRAAKKFSNCSYKDDALWACSFKETLQPGGMYTASLPYALGADTQAPGKEWSYANWMTTAEFEDFSAYLASRGIDVGKPGTDGELTLAEATGVQARDGQADTEPINNSRELAVTVTGENGVDLAAIGGSLSGKAGNVVTATVGVGNNGPATVDKGRAGSPVTKVDVAIPPGTTAVGVPADCAPRKANGEADPIKAGEPGHRSYRCFPGFFLGVGEKQTVDLQLRIDTVIADAAGSVTINATCDCDGGLTTDLDPANDVAKLLVNPSDGGGGGGGLPVTGASTGIIAGAGSLLLAAGAVGFVLARRRRMRFVA